MKNLYGLNFLLFLLAYQLSDSAFCDSVDDDPRIREKRNILCLFGLTDMIKDTLYSSLQDARKQDPVNLGDAWKGQLTDGVLRGLSTLTNTTDLKVFCNEDDLIIFTTTLRMRDAEVWYKWARRVVFKLKGSVWLKAKEVDFDLEVRLNATGGMNFEVTSSLITKLEDFKIGFKGLGVLNPVVSKVLKVLYKIWKSKVTDKIGLIIKRSLGKKLDTIAGSIDWITFL